MPSESLPGVSPDSAAQNSAAAPLIVTILCGDPADGRDFIRSVLGTEAGPEDAILVFQNQDIRLECLSTNPEMHAGWKTHVNRAHVLVLIIRNMDPESLRSARVRFGRLGGNRRAPLGVFVLREPDETEYKIGCPSCGQKLKLKENDVGKQGRCPSCRMALKIPSPADYLRDRLLLPDAIPILNVTLGNAALCRGALVNLLARTAVRLSVPDRQHQEAYLKQATVPIYFENDVRIGPSGSDS